MTVPKWSDMTSIYLADWPAMAELAAMAWRQAAIEAARDAALASNLNCNSWSISAICFHLDGCGIAPDHVTMQWAMNKEEALPPVSDGYFRARKP